MQYYSKTTGKATGKATGTVLEASWAIPNGTHRPLGSIYFSVQGFMWYQGPVPGKLRARNYSTSVLSPSSMNHCLLNHRARSPPFSKILNNKLIKMHADTEYGYISTQGQYTWAPSFHSQGETHTFQ